MSAVPESHATLCDISRDLRSGQQTAVAVVEECLSRIEEWEPSVRAWVSVDADGARAQAAALDTDAAAGRWRGPLHGIPVGIKDIIDVAGWPTAAGVSTDAVTGTTGRPQPAERDAPLVASLRRAGAIILGKTVTTAFACFDPPPTANPHNLDHTPGGSSSGSAAAVAAGMCLAAIGSQTGGSITRPAAFCGVAGAKPSLGRVPCTGVVPISEHLDHPGPLARSVADLATMLDVLSGHDPDDPGSLSLPHPGTVTTVARLANLPPQLGWLGGFFDERADEQARGAVATAVATWEAAGGAVRRPGLPPGFADVLEHHRIVLVAGLAANHAEYFPGHADEYPVGLAGLIREGLEFPMTRFIAARRHQRVLQREILACFNDCDVLVCPAATGAAPDRSTTGDPAMNAPWSYTGLPTVSFPVGRSSEGLPLAVQLVGRPRGEAALFAAAAWCEGTLIDSLSS